MKIALVLLSAVTFLSVSESRAQDVTVDFTATVKDTTCEMDITSLDASSVASNGNGNFILEIPPVGLEDIINKSSKAESSFLLMPKNCNASLTGLKMTMLAAELAGYSVVYAANDLTIAGHTENLGALFKKKSDVGDKFILVDNSQTVTWSADERVNGLAMTTVLREIYANKGTSGNFSARVTFTFTYQ